MKAIQFFIVLTIAVILLGVAAYFINNTMDLQKQAEQDTREESAISEYGVKNCKRIVSLTPDSKVEVRLADGEHSIVAGIGICVDPNTNDMTIESKKNAILVSVESSLSKFEMKDIFPETFLGEDEETGQKPPRLAGDNEIERLNSLRAEVLYDLQSEFPFITGVFFTSISLR